MRTCLLCSNISQRYPLSLCPFHPSSPSFPPFRLTTWPSSASTLLYIRSLFPSYPSVHPSHLPCIHASAILLSSPLHLPPSTPPCMRPSTLPSPASFLPSMLFCVPAGGSGRGGGGGPGPEGPQPAALHPAGAPGRPPREERAQGQGVPAAGGARLLQEVGPRWSPQESGLP